MEKTILEKAGKIMLLFSILYYAIVIPLQIHYDSLSFGLATSSGLILLPCAGVLAFSFDKNVRMRKWGEDFVALLKMGVWTFYIFSWVMGIVFPIYYLYRLEFFK